MSASSPCCCRPAPPSRWGSPKYWPIYQAATECGRPVVVHTGGYVDHRGAGYPSFYLEYHVGNGIVTQSQLAGHGRRRPVRGDPRCQGGAHRVGLAWAAALRWSLDTAWEQLRSDHPRLQRRPSEYIDEHVWFTTQPIEEPADPQHLCTPSSRPGSRDKLLFATDYPHWDFDSPTQALPRAMDKDLRHAVLCGNALNLYGLPHRDARTGDAGRGMTAVAAYERGAVDCDVHCAPASYADLLPYLSDYWRQYISEAAVRLTGVAHAYPPGGPVTCRVAGA